MNPLCPNCGEETGNLVDRRLDRPSGVALTFECPACEETWSIGL